MMFEWFLIIFAFSMTLYALIDWLHEDDEF